MEDENALLRHLLYKQFREAVKIILIYIYNRETIWFTQKKMKLKLNSQLITYWVKLDYTIFKT